RLLARRALRARRSAQQRTGFGGVGVLFGRRADRRRETARAARNAVRHDVRRGLLARAVGRPLRYFYRQAALRHLDAGRLGSAAFLVAASAAPVITRPKKD